MKIILAVDGSKHSNAVVEEAAARPWPANTEIVILSAVDPPIVPAAEPWLMPNGYYGDLEKAAQDRATAAVESAEAKLKAGGDETLKISSITPVGWAKQVILDKAEELKPDLIMVGSHGYGAFDRFLLGSISHSVSLHAPCSVEIVRRPPVAEAK